MSELGFGFEIKAIDEAGYIAGVAASYGNVDHGGDLIMPGALTKAIAGRSTVPMLRNHDHRQAIGAWRKFEESAEGLSVEGKIAVGTVAGREAHELATVGGLGGLSIGYKTLRHKFEGKTRQLHELALHEVSLVPVGMNERAVVTQIKDIIAAGEALTVRHVEDILRDADVPKALAKAIASKAKPLLDRGDSEEKTVSTDDFWAALGAALKV